MGKNTANKSGHCKYGGWSREGTKLFNEFHHLVREDRASKQSQEMESQLLAFAGLRRELSPMVICNMNGVVAMHWMKQRLAY